MTDSTDTRSKEQLLAEIEALKEQLATRGADANKPVAGASSEPIFSVPSAPMTRRAALTSWVAPVILSASVAGIAMKPGTAHAAVTRVPTRLPTRAPTRAPTVAPTAVPIPGPGVVGLAALGAAMAVAGAKLLKDRMDASDADGSTSGGASGGDRGSK